MDRGDIYKRISYPNCRVFPGQNGQFEHKVLSQKGGSSAWMHSANSVYIRPDELTAWTLAHIEQSPMFHPLEYRSADFATYTTGIYPVGVYYMNQAAQKHCANLKSCTQPGLIQNSIEVPTRREQLIQNLKKAMY